MRIRLGDEDRERLGCPEWMEADLDHVSVSEAEALDAAGGDWTDLGERGARAMKSRVWLALHRAGVTVTFDDLEFNVMAARGEAGKAEGSTDSESSTEPTSDSSTPEQT